MAATGLSTDSMAAILAVCRCRRAVVSLTYVFLIYTEDRLL